MSLQGVQGDGAQRVPGRQGVQGQGQAGVSRSDGRWVSAVQGRAGKAVSLSTII